MRCGDCGGLVLVQKSECHYFSDSDYYSDWIPVSSVEEADLLNTLWGSSDLEDYPYRSIRGNNFEYFWRREKEEPRPYDTGELRQKIREDYKNLTMEQKKLLEKLMEKAGKEEQG